MRVRIFHADLDPGGKSFAIQILIRTLLTGIDEIVKISKPLQGIYSGRYIDSTKLICVALTCSNRF
jgi:hypothetical protein